MVTYDWNYKFLKNDYLYENVYYWVFKSDKYFLSNKGLNLRIGAVKKCLR